MQTDTLTTILKLDGAANVAAGAGLVAAGSLLAGPLGIGSGWPIHLAGVALVAYGVENLIVARRTSRTGLLGLVAADLTFAGGLLVLAVADPWGAETWSRWALAVTADLSAVFGIVKLLGLRGLRAQGTGASSPVTPSG